jgi:hypothetical protein
MARPLFLICSESGAVDKATNSVSAFNIIETIQLFAPILSTEQPGAIEQPEDAPAVPKPIMPVRIVATWIGDDDDMGKEFEHETKIRRSNNPEWSSLYKGTFTWKTRNQRFTINIGGLILNPDSRLILIESSIRPTGSNERSWLTQKYEIVVEMGSPATVQ